MKRQRKTCQMCDRQRKRKLIRIPSQGWGDNDQDLFMCQECELKYTRPIEEPSGC